MVTVTSATPRKPVLFPLIPCGSETGPMVTLGCLATSFTPSSLTFSWTKNGASLEDFIQYPSVQKGDAYLGISQTEVRKQDWDARKFFQCAASHVGGNVRSSDIVKPKILYQLPTLKVLASSGEENEPAFSCFAKDFSPKDFEIKWLKGDEEITNKIAEIKTITEEQRYENGTKLYNTASFLTLQPNDISANTKVTCEFKGKNEDGDVFINSTVSYNEPCLSQGCPDADVDIKIEGPAMEDMFLQKKGTVKCIVKVKKSSVERIYWENQSGKEVAGASLTPNNGRQNSYTVPLDITVEEWSKGFKFFCVVEHKDWYEPRKETYERNIGKIQHPSVFMLPPVEHTKKDMVTLTCYVKDFSPKEVYVSWLADDKAAGPKYNISTTNPIENNGSYYVYGQLSFSLAEWKNTDMVFSCAVYHESVTNNIKAIVRTTGHSTSEKCNLVNLNMNIP